jgi:hypothetical protein
MSVKYISPLIAVVGLSILFLGSNAEKISAPIPRSPEKAPFQITVSYVRDQYQGHYADVSISADSSRGWLTGYDFFLSYNPDALTLESVEPGDLLKAEGWDSFDYERYSGDQIDSSHLAFLHLYATSDLPNIEIPPDDSVPLSNDLAALEFFVSTRRTFQCTFQPIRFYWRDCNDNVLYTLSDDSVAIVKNVYGNTRGVAVADSIESNGWHGPPHNCQATLHRVPVPMIDFINGGIDIACNGNIDPTGDINCNGYTYENADAVMFADYFVSGNSAFGSHPESSRAASDINHDGNMPTVADMVYLIRIIDGDAVPHLQVKDSASTTVAAHFDDGTVTVIGQSDSTIGAVLLVFNVHGKIRPPMLNPASDRMDMYVEAATYSGIPMKTEPKTTLIR